MSWIPNRGEAWTLLQEYTESEYLLKHAVAVEGVMKHFARLLGEPEVEFWGVVGLLHDLDYERYPDEHCIRQEALLRARGVDEAIIRATVSHGYNLTVDIKPEHVMEKVLYATDELTGLIHAVAIMRPSKSLMDLELKSVKKKYKAQNFAAGVSRKVIEDGAEMLGWQLDDVILQTLEGMKTVAEAIGLAGQEGTT